MLRTERLFFSGVSMRQQVGRVVGSIIFVLGCGLLLAADGKAVEYVVEKLALVGDPAPQTTGTYSAIYSGVSLNGPGDVGYSSGLTGGGATQATWVAHPDGSFEVVLTTDAPPMLPGVSFSYMGVPRLNDAGEFAFGAGLNSGFNNYAWFVQRSTGLELLARIGDPVPGLPGVTWSMNIDQAQVLSNGDVLLGAPLNRNPGYGSGVFILGAGSTDEVVVDGDVIPVVGSPLFTFVAPEADANSSGDVVFYGGGVRGVYVRVTGSLTAIAFEAGTAPGTPSSTYSFASAAKPSINEAGQIAFHAYRDPTAGGGLVSTVFIAEPGGSVTIASTQGDPVPGDPGRSFVNVGNPVINDAGELAFIGLSLDGGDLIWGIYVWRQGEVEVVAETGLEVSGTGAAQIASLDFNEIGFNNSGEVAFIAVLDDDRRGVLLASPAVALVPALTSRSLLVLAAVLASVGIRRRLGRTSWVFGNARYAEFC